MTTELGSVSVGPRPPHPGENLLVWLVTSALPHFIHVPKRKTVGFTRGVLFGFVLARRPVSRARSSQPAGAGVFESPPCHR